MYRIAILVAAMLVIWNATLAISCAQLMEGKFIRYDEARLNSVRQLAKIEGAEKNLIIALGYDANWHMKQPVLSVAEKTVFTNGCTEHDYTSLSRYYWPDPGKPNGLPYILEDGQTNPEREDLSRYDVIRLEKMISAVTFLSTAYYVTRQEEYAQRAVLWLRTWFINPASRMNPNMDFAQSVPGKTAGTPFGIIETVEFIQVVDAAMMLEDYSGWTEEDKDELQQWFKAYLGWLTDSPLGIKAEATRNNHGVWYDAQIAAYAYYIGDIDLVKNVLETSARRRIQEQIRPTGEMPQEMSRTRSLHYVLYNIRAFITLARLGDKVGINLWDYETVDGRGIKKAIDYAVPYILGEKEWKMKGIVLEKENSSAVYLAMADNHYRSPRYSLAAFKLLGKTTGIQELAVKTFILSTPGNR